MQPQGKKQVKEAVLTAALCTFVAGMVQWGVETARAKYQTKPKKKRKKKKPESE